MEYAGIKHDRKKHHFRDPTKMVKRKSPVAKGEQANRAKKEKVLNGQFQFKQFFSSGQQVREKIFFSHARTRTREKCVFCSEMKCNVLKCIEME